MMYNTQLPDNTPSPASALEDLRDIADSAYRRLRELINTLASDNDRFWSPEPEVKLSEVAEKPKGLVNEIRYNLGCIQAQLDRLENELYRTGRL
jgi:hypothetical protein